MAMEYRSFQGHQVAIGDPNSDPAWGGCNGFINRRNYIDSQNAWWMGCMQGATFIWPIAIPCNPGGHNTSNCGPYCKVAPANPDDCGGGGANIGYEQIQALTRPGAEPLDVLGILSLDPENWGEAFTAGGIPISAVIEVQKSAQPTVSPSAVPGMGIQTIPGTLPVIDYGGSRLMSSEDLPYGAGTLLALGSPEPILPAMGTLAGTGIDATQAEQIKSLGETASMSMGKGGLLNVDEWCFFSEQVTGMICPPPEEFGFVGAERTRDVSFNTWLKNCTAHGFCIAERIQQMGPGVPLSVPPPGAGAPDSQKKRNYLMIALVIVGIWWITK